MLYLTNGTYDAQILPILNSVKACPTPTNGGQTWVIVVGDSMMYGSFNNFRNAIQQSEYQESWTYDSVNNISVYYARIQLDTISIEYAWNVDSTLNSGIETFTKEQSQIKVYPNPASNTLIVNANNFMNNTLKIKAFNTIGNLVYSEGVLVTNNNFETKINTASWPQGVYLIMIENNTNRYLKKVIKTE